MTAVTSNVTRIAPTARIRPEVMAQFRRHSGSVLSGLFGAAAFDEVALVPVAAAVDKTGRFERNFTDRAIRSGFSALLAIWGDAEDRAAEGERLKRMHRDVHGHGKGEFADVRYSALNPRLWNWIAISGMFVTLNSFTPVTGIAWNDAEREAAYQQLIEAFGALELPGKSGKFPASYAAAAAYYDEMVHSDLAANPFLDRVTAGLGRLPLPSALPAPVRAAAAPLWSVLSAGAGRVVKICSFGIMHPGVRELTGFRWEPRHDAEFAFYTQLVQMAWRVLPDRVVLVPLAYNRMQYEKLVKMHRSVALDSFAPPAGCPMR
ncbi:hypothetical protein BST33_14760 [Mycolicibacter minnesotensis]|uniref:ER-bound oxygenase mpaB/mpaB'/Rubber oxygenase catalytic domain-containing protein n=1 Tax=Mycolicibacter minnesotensis TaxID=1118379 RepID=A0A7I7R7I1_9MYCO|nr:oxygenase MpaB family protein [Mycolicibacter minnesotensis]ORA99206.1 hypothetical protein BST33_14760 [Mycolicibacter minnesotensis]BBY34629.1 hypothetical protein MMIN_26900 [Mycolicibacter minnesotensis]